MGGLWFEVSLGKILVRPISKTSKLACWCTRMGEVGGSDLKLDQNKNVRTYLKCK
jgi:hypothetical protein